MGGFFLVREIEIAALMIMAAPAIDSAVGVVRKTIKSNIAAKITEV
jgi:hypothetical protein